MTSAAGEDRRDPMLLQLRACPQCGGRLEAVGPIRRCPKCRFDYGAATPRLPVWPWRWWHSNIVQTIASVLVALNLAYGVILLAMLSSPIGSFAAAALFSLPVLDMMRRKRRQARGEAADWICICPGGLVDGRMNFVLFARPWRTFEAFSLQRQAPGRWRLKFESHQLEVAPGERHDVEMLLADEQAEALQREIAAHLENAKRESPAKRPGKE